MLAVLVAIGLLLAAAAPAFAFFTPESGGSPNANAIDSLYKLILVVAIVVFLGVEGALFYSLFKFRARKGAVAAQIRGNTRLEIGWTVGAAVILVVLAVITFVKLDAIRNPPNSGPGGIKLANGVLTASASKTLPPNGKSLNICVNGQQYIWRYTYPANGTRDCSSAPLNSVFSYFQMFVPTDTTVTLDIRAQDVAHSWWIPKLGGKFDAVPGYTNHTWFKIHKPGVYKGQCAELCGRNHANMIAQVVALPPAQWEAWMTRQRNNIKQADSLAAAQRVALQSATALQASESKGSPTTTP
jgi:cytochrome c oxidase subunit II